METKEMIELHEFGKTLSILGFKEVRIPSIDAFLNRIRREVKQTPMQFLDASFVAGERHILFAALNALNAFDQDQSVSESLEVEILLYASGQRQISRAIELMGLKQDTSEIAVAFITANSQDAASVEEKISKTVPGVRDDSVIGFQEGKAERLLKAFEVTDTELETALKNAESLWQSLEKIIIERNALLAIKR